MSEFDVIIPVYNEGKNIINVLEGLRTHVKTPFQILICYDRDDDDTLAALRSYHASFNIRLVKNRGHGAHGAVVTGFRASTAPAALVFPADDIHNAAIVDAMYRAFREGCDVVSASRFMKGGLMKGCPWLKALLVRASAFTLYRFARLPTRDASNGFRLFSRRLLDTIPIESSRGFTYSIELLVKCHRLGWKIGEVPVVWFERTCGTSRFRVVKWLPAYLRWYFYAFATTYLKYGPRSVVKIKKD